MKKLVLMLLVLSLVAGSVLAATTQYQFTLAGSSAAINTLELTLGQSKDISIWIKTDVLAVTSTATFYGWDTSTTGTTTSVKLDNKVVGSLGKNIIAGWDTLPANVLEGGKKTSGVRPYGTYVAGSLPTGQSADLSGWTRLFNVTLTNAALTVGQSYVTTIWDNPGTTGPGFETYIAGTGGKYSPSATYNLTVSNPIPVITPEPATVLGLLAFAPALIAAARRRK